MAYTPGDWSVDSATKNIRYIGGDHDGTGGTPSYATVIEAHRAWQGLADDPTWTGDDEIAISELNPSKRSTDNIITLVNGYNIDAEASEHLYDGSIIQTDGDEIYDGIVNFGNADVQIQIIQNGAVLTDDWWNYAGGGLNPSSAQGISHRFMILVRTGAVDTDFRKLLGTTREFGKTYSEFPINGTSRGNNVLALSNSNDLNNDNTEPTVAGWTGITNTTEGYALIDVNNDLTDEAYYSEWDANTPTRSINDFYERMKWLTRDGSASTIYGLSGELFRGITHEVALSGANSGTFSAFEEVSWAGGTGQMLAIDNVTASSSTKMWIQLLTGSAPADTELITGVSTATATASGAATSRPISTPFVGVSTGSAIIGAYGVGVETDDLLVSDSVTDLTDTPISPPNNVTFSVGGLVIGEDYVFVTPWDGSTFDADGNPAINKLQMALNASLTADGITTVTIGHANGDVTTIPSDTPSSGYVRVVDDKDLDRRLHYTSRTTTTFTIDTADGNEDFLADEATAGNGVYLGYIDLEATAVTESYTAVYSADRNLVLLARDGGVTPIKEFITSAKFVGSNSTTTIIRTSDE